MAGGGVLQASEGPGPSSQDKGHAQSCGWSRDHFCGAHDSGRGAPRLPRPARRPAGSCCSHTGGCGPGHRPWALTRGLCASPSEDPRLSTTPEQLDTPPAADEGPAYPPLTSHAHHRLLSIQTCSVRRQVVACRGLGLRFPDDWWLDVSCWGFSYLRSLGTFACIFLVVSLRLCRPRAAGL